MVAPEGSGLRDDGGDADAVYRHAAFVARGDGIERDPALVAVANVIAGIGGPTDFDGEGLKIGEGGPP
jgi:hypothetical protein